jgi:hypothetical protein
MARAWILLGNPQYGWSGRLNPLVDDAPPGEPVAAAVDGVERPLP